MKEIKEKIGKMFESKIFVGILYGIGIVIILLLVLSAGISIGFHKASFGRAWGDNYERNFGMRPERPMLMLGKENFPNAHGAIGKIIKIELPTIIVQDKDNTEKVILTANDTQIQRMQENITANDLKINDFIVVIGSPNEQGQIEAKLIRLVPSPELMMSTGF
ncbi:hypothetical protein A2121_00525 [Candidatus Nomurabacteria bacterium GWB1_40_6]|uniref:DUF5666 domain-containing protein n=1 Tax=Candidatus Nomurabacteria bacterium GWB1_40_6 TaxID=1801727 RepID=A0A1F6TQ94_9BACT|nr:MAG: hypothetical protein A2121_00525 [Candidatus Nomurabacteria bacterium GWB1_40_6]